MALRPVGCRRSRRCEPLVLRRASGLSVLPSDACVLCTMTASSACRLGLDLGAVHPCLLALVLRRCMSADCIRAHECELVHWRAYPALAGLQVQCVASCHQPGPSAACLRARTASRSVNIMLLLCAQYAAPHVLHLLDSLRCPRSPARPPCAPVAGPCSPCAPMAEQRPAPAAH